MTGAVIGIDADFAAVKYREDVAATVTIGIDRINVSYPVARIFLKANSLPALVAKCSIAVIDQHLDRTPHIKGRVVRKNK